MATLGGCCSALHRNELYVKFHTLWLIDGNDAEGSERNSKILWGTQTSTIVARVSIGTSSRGIWRISAACFPAAQSGNVPLNSHMSSCNSFQLGRVALQCRIPSPCKVLVYYSTVWVEPTLFLVNPRFNYRIDSPLQNPGG